MKNKPSITVLFLVAVSSCGLPRDWGQVRITDHLGVPVTGAFVWVRHGKFLTARATTDADGLARVYPSDRVGRGRLVQVRVPSHGDIPVSYGIGDWPMEIRWPWRPHGEGTPWTKFLRTGMPASDVLHTVWRSGPAIRRFQADSDEAAEVVRDVLQRTVAPDADVMWVIRWPVSVCYVWFDSEDRVVDYYSRFEEAPVGGDDREAPR